MFEFFIFSTLTLIVTISCYYIFKKKGFNADRVNNSSFYTAMILITLVFSTLCNIKLLIDFIKIKNDLLANIAIFYIAIDGIHILMSLYKLFGKKFWSFYFDIRYAAERILNSNAKDKRSNIDYSKRSEVNDLLDEVVEDVKLPKNESRKKNKNKNEDKDKDKSSFKKNIQSSNSKKSRSSILDNSSKTTIHKKTDEEKEKIKEESRLAYEKEQEIMEEILALLDAKGL